MKKLLKFFLIFTSALGVLLLSIVIYAVCVTAGYSLDAAKLIDTEYTAEFYDKNGREISAFSGENLVSEKKDIPSYVKNAFVAVEDKRFYSHKGIDLKALARAAFNNIKSFSFKEGASTISQQLIKNTHLTNEKTIRRKLIEFKLTRQLEKKFTKEEILEMYLNTIYFGKNSYGITVAAKNYFNKNVGELTLGEAAALAGVVKAPSAYSPANDIGKCKERRNLVLKLMKEQNMISESERAKAAAEEIVLAQGEKSAGFFYLERAKAELENILEINPYSLKKCKIYTFYDPEAQALLYDHARSAQGDFTGILIDNGKNAVRAFYSACGDGKRQAGSALKPLAVYAPAIQTNYVSECTPILDEKTDFGGYSPSNYGENYGGYISVKESLEKSSNVCAVKILNGIGAETGRRYLGRLGIGTEEGDATLALALGATAHGVSLEDLSAAYTAFPNGGEFARCAYIERVEADGVLYEYRPQRARVFSEECACVMNYMLKGVSRTGTAQKLGALDLEIAAKTGTVGTKGGNSDAYCISYSPEYTLGIRLSGNEQPLPNNVTGGGAPATAAFRIWKNLKTDKTRRFADSANVVKCELDKLSYEQDHLLLLADENAPAKYKTEGYFIKSNLPKERSSRFSTPDFKSYNFSVNNNEILVQLCKEEYVDYLLYREVDGRKKLIFDSGGKENAEEYADEMEQAGKLYSYYAVPYYAAEGGNILGKEIFLGKARCPKRADLPDNWWETDWDLG